MADVALDEITEINGSANGGTSSKTHSESNGKLNQNGESNDIDDEPAEEANISDLIPQPPDGGWGWVIVIVSFMNHFIIDGIGYAFGTMLSDYANHFQSSAATAGALMSTLIGCYLLSGDLT